MTVPLPLPWAMLLGGLLLAAPMRAQDPAARPAPGLPREFRVPMTDGRVDLADLVAVLAQGLGLDDAALSVPHRSLDLGGARGTLLLFAARKVLLDSVRFQRAERGAVLVIHVDRERAQEVRRRLRARLVQWVGELTDQDLQQRRYRLDLPPAMATDRPLVVLIHGVESSAAVWDDLRAFLAGGERPPQVATFVYPNDEALERSAAALAEAVADLAPQRVALVGHSMGGLLARAVVEDAELDPGNVGLLVQIGTPNGGSRLAGLRFALEAAALLRPGDDRSGFGRRLLAGMRANLVDGLGEAGGDLLPGSVCLLRLQQHDRNPGVVYRQVLGTRAPLTAAQLQDLRAHAGELLDDSPTARLLRPRLLAWLADLDEVVDGAGDGAVSVGRGRLVGVEPLLVPLDHVGLVRRRGLLTTVAADETHPVFAAVQGWLTDFR